MPPKGKAPPPPPILRPRPAQPKALATSIAAREANSCNASPTLGQALATRRTLLDAQCSPSRDAQEASLFLEQGRAREITLDKDSATALDRQPDDLKDVGNGIVLVAVRKHSLNDTLDPKRFYTTTAMNDQPLTSLGDEPERCEKCGRLFKSFSMLYSHQGRTCSPPEQPEAPLLVRVSFDASRMPLLKTFLSSNGFPLIVADGKLVLIKDLAVDHGFEDHEPISFAVDVSLLQRTLKQLYFAEASCYNLEQWYAQLQHHTSRSVIIPLLDTDLTVLTKLRAAWHVGNHAVDMETMGAFEGLVDRVSDAVWGRAERNRKYFVKTSMRSPKDACDIDHQPGDASHIRLRKEIEACAVESARDALLLLIRSKRVAEDIASFIKYRCESAASGQINMIFREWDEQLLNSVEWRCFVVQGRLTVISQYHCYHVLPDLVEAAAEFGHTTLKAIRSRIACFQRRVHEQIISCIGIASYVLDVATAVNDDVNDQVRLIEINPVHTSGAALFSWRHDESLILCGRQDGEIELRIASSMLA